MPANSNKTPVFLLPKTDPKYIKWRESLKNRDVAWSRGKTKETDSRVKKISETFKRKKIDNFKKWRIHARETGLMPNAYPDFDHSKELAYLIGIVLGDGHIDAFPRTEKLNITLGTDKPKLITFTVSILEKVIHKHPHVYKARSENAAKIDLYQKFLSKRLGVPTGKRRYSKYCVPGWIMDNKNYLLSYLRGLYEAEASFCVHIPTYTYNFCFCNLNTSLLDIVDESLKSLGFHPERRVNGIRIRKKKEAYELKRLLNFRRYDLL